MSGERRLIDETDDPLTRALLGEARDYRASDEARAATLAALGLGGPTGGAGGGHGALGAGKVVVGLAIVGAAAAVVYFAFADPKMPTTPSTSAPPVTASAASDTVAPPLATLENTAPAVIASAAAPSPSAHVPAPKDVGTGNAPSLADEVLLIDRARSALYDHDKEGSLRALDEYDRRFPPAKPGRMAPEAKSLRERALRLP